MMKTLDLYLGRSIIQTTGFALMVLVGISTLIKFIEQLKSVGRGSYDIATALIYTLYSMPGDLVIFFPMAALIGGLTGLGALASNSELVVMQAAGMSRLQIIASVMKTAMLILETKKLFPMVQKKFLPLSNMAVTVRPFGRQD